MITGDINVRAVLLPQHSHATGFIITRDDNVERKRYAGHITWEEVGPHTLIPYAFMVEEYRGNTLQSLMDDLWRTGVRPSGEYHGTAGQLAVAQKHIDDLRTIAFKLLKIP